MLSGSASARIVLPGDGTKKRKHKNAMKTVKFKLVLNVEIDTMGEAVKPMDLRESMCRALKGIVEGGTLTGGSPATVEKYDFSVKQVSA